MQSKNQVIGTPCRVWLVAPVVAGCCWCSPSEWRLRLSAVLMDQIPQRWDNLGKRYMTTKVGKRSGVA